MTSVLASVDTSHSDMVHDVQYDYYSKRLATCSSDRTIKIFDINGEVYHNSMTLDGHEGPVWQVAWAHPRFGVILASSSYDGTVIIHKEVSLNNWTKIYTHKVHDSSVNSISWAPHEYGLILACASSDGNISTIEYKEGNWIVKSFQNDTLGCNSVSWAPYGALGSQNQDGSTTRFLVTGSCDNSVR
jgi:protein transport protein SEC13